MREIRAGSEWENAIKAGLRDSAVCLALLTPHSVRSSSTAPIEGQDPGDSVCLDEIAFARYLARPVVPAMVIPCEPPLSIFRLDCVDFSGWHESEGAYQDALDRLVAGLEAALDGKVSYQSWIKALNPWDFGAFLQEKREGFTGRRWHCQVISLQR